MEHSMEEHNAPQAAKPAGTTERTLSQPKNDVRTEAEAESILSAIEVGRNDDISPVGDMVDDPEKAAAAQAHEPIKRTVTAQDWSGPDDPENPQNWSTTKKAYHTAATALLGFAVTCGSSMITPGTPEIERDFDISRTVAILPLSLFVLGLALGPVLAAPVSETFGRSVVYKISAPAFMLFILGSGFSKSLGSLLVCRFLAGALGGPVLAVGAGTNADMYDARNRAIASACFVMMPFLGPSLGPVIGGFAAQFKGWRWTQWCTIFVGLAATALIMPMSETHKKTILQRRAKKLGIAPPPGPPVKGLAYAKMLITITLIRPLNMLFTEPIVALLSLYTAFTFSVLFAFFAAYPYTFETVYGFNTWQYGLTFLGIGLGVLLAVLTAMIVNRVYYLEHHQRVLREGKRAPPPEYRLMCAQLGSFGISIGLFWFAWTARPSIHWISPVLAGIPFAWGNLCVFISAAMYFIDVYGPLNGASAMAANGVARYGMGAVFPLFTVQMYERLGVAWATSLLAFVSVAMLPIPWVFFRFGEGVRGRSRYETVKY